MSEALEPIGGLEAVHVTVGVEPRLAVVVLHGYAMRPEDLVPFARSMGVPAEFYFPEAPLDADPAGKAWWPIDQERRARALAVGPRDLSQEHPAGAAAARRLLAGLVEAVRSRHSGRALAIIGFSQGGMLACDALLRGEVRADALALLSSSRIAANEWEPLAGSPAGAGAGTLAGVQVLVSHGAQDQDLAFAAGEALRDFCERAGAIVTWRPLAGGHEIPLLVWRGVRRLLGGLSEFREATEARNRRAPRSS